MEILCRTDTSAQIIHFLNDIRVGGPGRHGSLSLGDLSCQLTGNKVLISTGGWATACLCWMLQPGTECYLRAMGGLRLKFEGHRVLNQGREIKRIGLLAGGTGE